MSTRWYPLFQLGNPQLRIFLPNFWMKLVHNGTAEDNLHSTKLQNRVKFMVSMEMTRYDIKTYLKGIYDVDAVTVSTEVRSGATREIATKSGKMVVKDDDFKIAYVTLAEGQSFVFPDIYPKDKAESKDTDDKKHLEQVRHRQVNLKAKGESKPDLPGWFT